MENLLNLWAAQEIGITGESSTFISGVRKVDDRRANTTHEGKKDNLQKSKIGWGYILSGSYLTSMLVSSS